MSQAYREAGVDIEAGERAVEAMKSSVSARSTRNGRVGRSLSFSLSPTAKSPTRTPKQRTPNTTHTHDARLDDSSPKSPHCLTAANAGDPQHDKQSGPSTPPMTTKEDPVTRSHLTHIPHVYRDSVAVAGKHDAKSFGSWKIRCLEVR